MTGSVEKTIPRAWKFAKENFVIRNSPSIEVYSAGDRLNKKYRMKLWIPITDVLPNFKKNTSFMGNLRRKVSDSVENVIEFSKTDTGKKVFVVGGTVFVAGVTWLLVSLANTNSNNEEFDSDDDSDIQNDENFDTENYSVSEVLDNEKAYLGGTHDYPDERKSPIVHIATRGETKYLRGGSDDEKQAFREENNLDF